MSYVSVSLLHNKKGGRQTLMEGGEKGGWEKEKERGRGENGSE